MASLEERVKVVEEVWRVMRTRHRFVVGIYLLLVVLFGILAWLPDSLHLAVFDAKKNTIVFAGWWETFFGVVAFLVAILMAIYIYTVNVGVAQNVPGIEVEGTYVLRVSALFIDELEQHLSNPIRSKWGQRALYVGAEGTSHWLAVSSHKDYKFDFDRLRKSMAEVLTGTTNVAVMISLGPGDGEIDRVMLSLPPLNQNVTPLTYVPVDISEGLLLLSMKKMRRHHPNLQIPFGILGDFELGWSRLAALATQHTATAVALWTLLGNTAANLDDGLEQFLTNVWPALKPGDYLLFDVLLGDFDQKLKSIDSADFDPNLLFPTGSLWAHYMRFIAQGARRISLDHDVYDDHSAKLSTSLLRLRREKSEGRGYDQLHLEYIKSADPLTIFRWRRYLKSTAKLEEWLKNNLNDCKVVRTSQIEEDGDITQFILLCKKPSG